MMHMKALFKLFLLVLCTWLTFVIGKPQDSKLFEAINSDDVHKIDSLLKQGININTKGPGGQTPIMFATLRGSYNAVKYLLDHKADTTIPEKDGYTPMHGAAFQGRGKIAQLLIDNGINPRDIHKDGYEPIFRACWGTSQRHTDTVNVFLQNGVPIDVKAKDGLTTLFDATRNNPNTIKLLNEWKNKQKKGEL